MEFKDYYSTLGIKRDATPEEIKRAYRKKARQYHPDVSKEADAEERFKEVQEAYAVLKDPEKREAYDRFGKDWKAGQDFSPPPGWEREFASQGDPFAQAGGFSDFFESLFGGAAPRGDDRYAHITARGQDAHAKITISLEDAYAGVNRALTLSTSERGAREAATRTLSVRIPAGVTAGQRIRLAGQGGPGFGGRPNGDLFIEISFAPHRLFRPEDRDLYLELPIAPWEAALGSAIPVPTLGGKVELKIPAGSQSGNKLRLKGRGLPGDPPGNQYVVLSIVTPIADTAAARTLYERMEKEFSFDPRAELES